MVPSAKTYRNQLLALLSPQDLALLAPHLEHKEFAVRYIIEEPGRAIRHVYFVERGFASMVANGISGREVEVGLIGREGMTGTAVVLGSDRSPHATYIQLAGGGYRLTAAALRTTMAASNSLRGLLLNYAHILMVQTAQTALANGRAKLEERLARWILMGRDRINGDALHLTHEFLSIMLGVRRAGVTEALHILEGRGLIGADRGNVHVVDRKGLEKVAGGTYGVPEAEYRRLIG